MTSLFMIGSRPVTLYGALTAGALLCFWVISLLYMRKQKGIERAFPLYLILTAVLGWLVSRLVFVAADASYYIDELNGYWQPALCFWDGGYSFTGMLLGVTLGAFLCAKATGIKRASVMNAAGLGLAGGAAVLRLAEFLCDTAESGDIGEGKYLEGGWLDGLLERTGLLMKADGDLVYPACLAEFAVMLLIFIGLLVWIHRVKDRNDCDVLGVSLLLMGCAQLVLEQIRDDGHLVFHFVHIQQVLALGIVLAVMIVWTRRAAKKDKALMLILWIVSVVCIGLAVWACFGVDRWENKLLAWGILIVSVLIVCGSALRMRVAKAEVK